MDVIPLDASLVRGSHGRLPESRQAGPVLISSEAALVPADVVRRAGLSAFGFGGTNGTLVFRRLEA